MSQTSMPMGGEEPHEFKPGACAWPGCGKWHTNAIHDVRPSRPVDAPTDPVGRNHPETARRQGERVAPRLGSKRRLTYDWIRQRGSYGATAREVGDHFGWEHQSYSPAVSTLKRDGWIRVDRTSTGESRERDGAHVMVVARVISAEAAA